MVAIHIALQLLNCTNYAYF